MCFASTSQPHLLPNLTAKSRLVSEQRRRSLPRQLSSSPALGLVFLPHWQAVTRGTVLADFWQQDSQPHHAHASLRRRPLLLASGHRLGQPAPGTFDCRGPLSWASLLYPQISGEVLGWGCAGSWGWGSAALETGVGNGGGDGGGGGGYLSRPHVSASLRWFPRAWYPRVHCFPLHG